MELEEMKVSWEALGKKLENQKRITPQIIETMITQNYKTRLNKIAVHEWTGTVICYMAGAVMIFNFHKVEHFYVQVCALLCMAILFILPLLSLKLLHEMKILKASVESYAETIKQYTRQSVRYQKFQMYSVLFSLALMMMAVPVLREMFAVDMHQSLYFWPVIVPLSLLLFFGFALFVIRYYNRVLRKAERILADLDI